MLQWNTANPVSKLFQTGVFEMKLFFTQLHEAIILELRLILFYENTFHQRILDFEWIHNQIVRSLINPKKQLRIRSIWRIRTQIIYKDILLQSSLLGSFDHEK